MQLRKKPVIAQCAKCQHLGHTKTYCQRQTRCIKYAGPRLMYLKHVGNLRLSLKNVYFVMKATLLDTGAASLQKSP